MPFSALLSSLCLAGPPRLLLLDSVKPAQYCHDVLRGQGRHIYDVRVYTYFAYCVGGLVRSSVCPAKLYMAKVNLQVNSGK